VCGYCVYAIQFYPLATLKVDGRPLFWWASDPRWTWLLNRQFLESVQKVVAASSEQFGNLNWPATQLMRCASRVVEEWKDADVSNRPPLCDLIGCHVTNYGPQPTYDELRIPRGLLEFWANAGSFGAVYQEIVKAAWEEVGRKRSKPRNSKRKRTDPGAQEAVETSTVLEELNRRNLLYEDLGRAFRSEDFRNAAKRVAVRFFLKRTGTAVAAGTFELAGYFLERVVNMEKARLEAVREIADAIAECSRKNDIIDRLMRSRGNLYSFVPVMRYAQRELCSSGRAIPWGSMLLALGLQGEDDATSRDSWLVNELMLIRIFERLAESSPEVLKGLPEAEVMAVEPIQKE